MLALFRMSATAGGCSDVLRRNIIMFVTPAANHMLHVRVIQLYVCMFN